MLSQFFSSEENKETTEFLLKDSKDIMEYEEKLDYIIGMLQAYSSIRMIVYKL